MTKTTLNKVKAKAKKLKIEGEIYLSDRKNKKLKILTPSNKWVHFGAKNSTTFIEGASEKKRNSYRARHSKIILKDGRRAIDVKYSPAFLSWNLLW